MGNVCVGIDKSGSFRFYITDTTEVVQTAMDLHGTTPLATAGLGRVLTGCGLMGLQLKKEEDRLTVIFKGDGPAVQILAVGNGKGEVKGYIANPEVDLPLKENGKLDVGGSLGIGELTVIKDMGLKEPYSGTIALVSGEIAEDLTAYHYISEQQNTAIALGVKIGTDGNVAAAGGLFIQVLPEATEEALTALEERLAFLPPVTELLSKAEDLNDLTDLVFSPLPEEFQPRILEYKEITWHCGCSRERMAQALMTIGEEELSTLLSEDGQAELSCQFCGSRYLFTEEDLRQMLDTIGKRS